MASQQPYHGGAAADGGAPSPLDLAPDGDGDWTAGEVQPRRCNDAPFAALFYLHLGAMALVPAAFAPRMYRDVAATAASEGGRRLGDGEGGDGGQFLSRVVSAALSALRSTASGRFLEEDGDDTDDGAIGTNDIGDMLLLLGISALLALGISTLALGVMIRHAEVLIKFALLFNVAATAVFAIGSLFLSPFAALIGLFLFGLTVYYAYVVWGRIPFAACNLVAATTAVRANLGLGVFAYASLLLLAGWSAWWTVAFVSTVYVTSGCDGGGNCASEPHGAVVFALLLSFYWTFQVVKNVVHVTVAGTVGTWWFVPAEGAAFCSRGVRDSHLRAVTTSFGSICLGSLLVAVVEALKTMARSARESDDSLLLCLAECVLRCLQDIMEYFNTWAFVFVGLYGYTFIDAGKNVINLFKTRGWTTIITDNLAQGVLQMVSAGVGLITGLAALGIAHARGMVFGDELGASAAAFFCGFVIGFVLTSTLMTLVSSAVNTVIVCYAEAPQQFQENHPKLSEDMRAAWRQAWPTDFQY